MNESPTANLISSVIKVPLLLLPSWISVNSSRKRHIRTIKCNLCTHLSQFLTVNRQNCPGVPGVPGPSAGWAGLLPVYRSLHPSIFPCPLPPAPGAKTPRVPDEGTETRPGHERAALRSDRVLQNHWAPGSNRTKV